MALVRALGLMSGTSMDGIDVAYLSTDGEGAVGRGPFLGVTYEAAFRRRIEAALDEAKSIRGRDERPGDLALLERGLTLRHAEAVRAFLDGPGRDLPKPDVIGFHGQTVLHRPEIGLTVQLGDGALLARETGIPVIYDMRANDMAHGGQGAPLVPAYHAALARGLPEDRFPVAFVNIGGISNITFVDSAGDPVAFDSGPGNALIDQWVQAKAGIPYDAGGRIASEGAVDESVAEAYLGKPFFSLPGPKSLDRNDFTLAEAQGLGLHDGARTLAAVSARAILKAADILPARPKTWIVCGGGRRNDAIMADLRAGAKAAGGEAILAEEAGFDGDAMEAEAWAYLAVRSLKGLALTFPTTTGCRSAATGGVRATP